MKNSEENQLTTDQLIDGPARDRASASAINLRPTHGGKCNALRIRSIPLPRDFHNVDTPTNRHKLREIATVPEAAD